MPAQQLDFSAAIKDGPAFRWQLKRVEDQIQQQCCRLERVSSIFTELPLLASLLVVAA